LQLWPPVSKDVEAFLNQTWLEALTSKADRFARLINEAQNNSPLHLQNPMFRNFRHEFANLAWGKLDHAILNVPQASCGV